MKKGKKIVITTCKHAPYEPPAFDWASVSKRDRNTISHFVHRMVFFVSPWCAWFIWLWPFRSMRSHHCIEMSVEEANQQTTTERQWEKKKNRTIKRNSTHCTIHTRYDSSGPVRFGSSVCNDPFWPGILCCYFYLSFWPLSMRPMHTYTKS